MDTRKESREPPPSHGSSADLHATRAVLVRVRRALTNRVCRVSSETISTDRPSRSRRAVRRKPRRSRPRRSHVAHQSPPARTRFPGSRASTRRCRRRSNRALTLLRSHPAPARGRRSRSRSRCPGRCAAMHAPGRRRRGNPVRVRRRRDGETAGHGGHPAPTGEGVGRIDLASKEPAPRRPSRNLVVASPPRRKHRGPARQCRTGPRLV